MIRHEVNGEMIDDLLGLVEVQTTTGEALFQAVKGLIFTFYIKLLENPLHIFEL